MCTAFAIRGRDVICGFNLDLPDGAWSWNVHAEPDSFYVTMTIPEGSSLFEQFVSLSHQFPSAECRAQGVDAHGHFAVMLNVMEGKRGLFREDSDALQLSQLVEEYQTGKRSFEEVIAALNTHDVLNLPGHTHHALFADAQGRFLIAEPGSGYIVVRDRFAVNSNFALLDLPADLTPERWSYYGKDRYDTAMRMLRDSGDDFSVQDAFSILRAVQQTKYAPTRVSFVYSRNENAVYYTLERDFDHITRHALETK